MSPDTKTETVSTVNSSEKNEMALAPGEQLRNAREQQGFNLVEVAEYLRLTRKVVEALESDHYEALPDRPFVMGYLRAYARLVKLDGEVLITDYQRHLGLLDAVVADVSSGAANEDVQVPGVSQVQRLFKGKLYLVVGGLLLLWVIASSLLTDKANDEAWQSSEPALVTDVAVLPSEDESALESAVDESIDDTESATIEADETLLAKSPATALLQSPASIILDQLQIKFNQECWLEVTDAIGDVIAVDLYQAGVDLKLEGVAPFTISLGNYKAVELSLNGAAQQLSSNGRGNTLRTTIGSKD